MLKLFLPGACLLLATLALAQQPIRFDFTKGDKPLGVSNCALQRQTSAGLVLYTQWDPNIRLPLADTIDAPQYGHLVIRMYSSTPSDAFELMYSAPDGDWALGLGPPILAGWHQYDLDLAHIQWHNGGQSGGGPDCERWGGGPLKVESLRLDPGNFADRLVVIRDCVLQSSPATTPLGEPGTIDRASVQAPASATPGATITATLSAHVATSPAQAEALPDRLWLLALSGGRPAGFWDIDLGAQKGPDLRLMLPVAVSRYAVQGKLRLQALFSAYTLADGVSASTNVGVLRPTGAVKPPVAEVKPLNGRPTLLVNGKPTFSTAFLSPSLDCHTEMAAAGIHLYNDCIPLGNAKAGQYDFAATDQTIISILEADPEAYFLPRIDVTAPGWWQTANPDECALYVSGKRGPQSFASDKWLANISKDLDAFIQHVRQTPYADRVIGFHICSGYTGEWQQWGVWDNDIGDYSAPMVAYFRRWLRARYGTDERLRAAWHNDAVTLDGASLPTAEQRMNTAAGALRDLSKEQPVVDFYAAYNEVAADAICHLAKVAKAAGNRQSVVAFFYGYLTQHGGLQQDSGHCATAKALDCPDIDILCSPTMYSGREIGGASSFMSATASVRLHGKLWFDETDLRTHLTERSAGFGRVDNLAQTRSVMLREMANVLTHGCAMWWFDMSGGWFSDKTVLSDVKRMREILDASKREADARNAEIAVFIDEPSILATRPRTETQTNLILQQIVSLPRVGASTDVYLLSDLARRDFPDYRLYVFLNAFAPTAEARRAIAAKVTGRGRHALWVYAPGTVTTSGIDTEAMRQMTGFAFERGAGVADARIRLTQPAHPLFADIKPDESLGAEQALAPTFIPRSGRILATQADGATAAIAVSEDGQSIYYPAPFVPPAIIRNAARLAGVHIFSDSGDALYTSSRYVGIHAATAGRKTISLPSPAVARDAMTGRKVGEGTSIVLDLGMYETRLLRLEALARPGP